MRKFSAGLAAAKWIVRMDISVAFCVSFGIVMSLTVDELLEALLSAFTWHRSRGVMFFTEIPKDPEVSHRYLNIDGFNMGWIVSAWIAI